MRILVLGGAGYIGSHTVYELIDGACSTSFQTEKRNGYTFKSYY